MGNVLKFAKMSSAKHLPVIIVLGSTGTGKSNLSIELAKKFNGEIISSDSMQVYKGLDIITNKVTHEEQKEVKHHCIDFINPPDRYTVVDFRDQALPIINRILNENKLPIIVGGTNYYIESVLWNVLVNDTAKREDLLFNEEQKTTIFDVDPCVPPQPLCAENVFQHKITLESFKDAPSANLHKILHDIDPKMADTLHPEEKRKIIRSLQVYQQHGRCHSDILEEQCSQDGGSSLGGPLRFNSAVMLWIQCEKEVLKKRLDDRVDDMLKKGLIAELLEFHKSYNEKRVESEASKYTEGIFQSIGFKEFHEYLTLSEEERLSEKGKIMFERGIEEMKLVTRQYARKQTKWIENRFLRKPDRQSPPVYGLDATDLSLWKENVLQPAIRIVESLIEGTKPIQEPLPFGKPIEDVKETHYCDICDRIFVGKRIWEIHLTSRNHQKRKSKLQKKVKMLKTEHKPEKSDHIAETCVILQNYIELNK